MSLLNTLIGGNIESIVNQYIETIIESVAEKYGVDKHQVEFVVHFVKGEPDAGKFFIVTDNLNNRKKYRISDANLRNLIVSAKKRKRQT